MTKQGEVWHCHGRLCDVKSKRESATKCTVKYYLKLATESTTYYKSYYMTKHV